MASQGALRFNGLTLLAYLNYALRTMMMMMMFFINLWDYTLGMA